ncbi:hypothetical protein [Methyloglobulus sp.]|uniref:hypothetical protein n=1 Tax=Methyloglobulus sp. TaxID=2518622 RepID=UPI003988B36C
MLSEPLQLGKVDASKIIDFLYTFFHRDFVANKTYLSQTVYINPRSDRLDDGKELVFWHLTTRENKRQVRQGNRWVWISEGRCTDYARSERIEWVKQVLVNHDHPSIRLFYHRENNAKRNIRLYLWAHEHDFVVILQKLGRSSSFLVTSFYLSDKGKCTDYERRYCLYKDKQIKELDGCEWF